MDDKLYGEYLKQRYREQRGYPWAAKYALQCVRFNRRYAPKFQWENGEGDVAGHVKFKIGVFSVRVEVLYDQDFFAPDQDLGEFLDHPSPGSVQDDNYRGDRPNRWYLPPKDCGIEETTKLYRERGQSKAVARDLAVAEAKAWMERLDDHKKGRVPRYGVRARVYLGGRELGESSVWGIDLATDSCFDQDPYIMEVVEDQVQEAIGEAEEEVEKLRKVLEKLEAQGTGVVRKRRKAECVRNSDGSPVFYEKVQMPWEGLGPLHEQWRVFLLGMFAGPMSLELLSTPVDISMGGPKVLRWADPQKDISGEFILRISKESGLFFRFSGDDRAGEIVEVWPTAVGFREDVQDRYMKLQNSCRDLQSGKSPCQVMIRQGGKDALCTVTNTGG
jgi:hypothetical protein